MLAALTPIATIFETDFYNPATIINIEKEKWFIPWKWWSCSIQQENQKPDSSFKNTQLQKPVKVLMWQSYFISHLGGAEHTLMQSIKTKEQ